MSGKVRVLRRSLTAINSAKGKERDSEASLPEAYGNQSPSCSLKDHLNRMDLLLVVHTHTGEAPKEKVMKTIQGYQTDGPSGPQTDWSQWKGSVDVFTV
jgi:hypothetical protein